MSLIEVLAESVPGVVDEEVDVLIFDVAFKEVLANTLNFGGSLVVLDFFVTGSGLM